MTTKDADLSALGGSWDPVSTTAPEVARDLDVDPASGLSAEEAASGSRRTGRTGWPPARRSRAGARSCASTRTSCRSSCWRAALVNQIVTGETGTTVVLAGLTVFNAVIGLRQEAKAEESVKALSQMMKTIARVRRDGQAVEIDAEELVPGRRRAGRGRQPGARRRPGDPGRDAGDRGGGADRREPAGRQVDRPGAGRGRPARRPDLHGLHEHLGHPRPRRADRDRDRHGHRDRPHRRHAGQHRDEQDAAAEAARRAVQDHRVDRRGRAGRSSCCSAWPGASRSTPCSSPASRSPWRRSRPACRPW